MFYIILFSTLLLIINVYCQCTDNKVECVDVIGNPGEISIGCPNASYTLVSCGIRIDREDLFQGLGTKMVSDTECNIIYQSRINTKQPTASPLPPTLPPTLVNSSAPTSDPTLEPTLPTVSPTMSPATLPSPSPTTAQPTQFPSIAPTLEPTIPTLGPSKAPTISNDLYPIPYARCCDFAACYPSNFDCNLNVERTQADITDTCSANRPHLLSCMIEQRFYDNTTMNVFGGVVYSVAGQLTTSSINMQDGYFQLFNIPTGAPTSAPTASPSQTPTSPTTASPTSSPTVSTPTTPTASIPTNPPTLTPTLTPTSPNPTPSPTNVTNNFTRQRDFGANYTYSQSTENVNQCTTVHLPSDTNGNFLWLYSLCCTEKPITTSQPTAPTAPSSQPTTTPSQAPSTGPTESIFSEDPATPFSTPYFPLFFEDSTQRDETIEFDDTGDGAIRGLRWGISNILRNFTYLTTVDPDTAPGIDTITDIVQSEYYFTIKGYETDGTEFTAEYGTIFLEDATPRNLTHRYNHTDCTEIPFNKDQQISVIHIYVDETNQKILGMTMYTGDGIFTCHIAMAENGTSAQELITQSLSEPDYENYTLNYTQCGGTGAALAGFKGAAPGLGIKYIQFEFVASLAIDGNVAGCGSLPTFQPTTGPEPTFSPTPGPTNIPTINPATPTVSSPTPPDQYEVNQRFLFCYYVMDIENATCLGVGDTVQNGVSTQLDNPSFMTGCAGYSLFGQPNEYFITNNTCHVHGIDKSQPIAAIATCCCLQNPPTTTTTDDTLTIIGIVAGGVVVVGIWIGFIVFCIKQRERAEEQEELNTVKEIRDGDGRVIGIALTDEQKALRLDLEPFAVTEEEHDEMLKMAKRNSAEDIGLI